MQATQTQRPANWVISAYAFNTYMTTALLGGKRIMAAATAINAHKLATPFVVIGLMLHYNNFTPAAWLYLGLHGSYVACWLLKHFAFRDPKWEYRVTLGGGLFTFLLLGTYWIAPWLLISGVLYDEPRALPGWLTAVCVALVVVGASVMLAADCQKKFTLKYGPGLITDGLFSRMRHPNYLGEMMVYAGFATVVGLIWPWFVLAYWWVGVFLVNILMIEASLSRYPEWRSYKQRTWMLLPKIF